MAKEEDEGPIDMCLGGAACKRAPSGDGEGMGSSRQG